MCYRLEILVMSNELFRVEIPVFDLKFLKDETGL